MVTAPELKLYARFTDKEKFDFSVERLSYSVIFILERGRFAYSIGDQDEQIAETGDVIYCPADMPFRRRVIEPVTLHVLRFQPVKPEPQGGMLELDRVNRERIMHDLSVFGNTSFVFKQSFDHKEAHFLLDIKYCIDLLGVKQLPSAKIIDSTVTAVKTKIDNSIGDKLSVNHLADELGLTPAALIRRFKRSEGVTPMEYIIAARIKKASQLLVQSDLPIGEIALLCGFENAYYFSNSFKKRCGCSPTDFRCSARF